jgi:glutamine amidotransferase
VCRVLAIQGDAPFDAEPFLSAFAEECRRSKEFQGDGWGVAWREGIAWRSFHTLQPIWETALPDLPRSRLFLVHARSAFRNERIVVENNMPFVDDGLAFAFNGELRRVRLRAPGDTGARRLFHLYRRFRRAAADTAVGDEGRTALRRLDEVIRARTEYVRALNVVVSDGEQVWVNNRFSEDPDYFTLWTATSSSDGTRLRLVSSERFDLRERGGLAWQPLSNGATENLREAPRCSS